MEYQAQGTLVSGPWGIPIAILGQYGTGNARQYFPTNPGSGWKDLISGGSVADGFTGNLWPQGIPFLIHAGEASSSEPGVTGYACLPETAPLLPGSSADSPEACIAACGAALAPNNAAYFANLYGTGNDTCGTFCTCAGTCQDKRLVAGQTYPVCYAPNVFEATTTTNKKHTGRVLRGGMVRFTLKLRQNVAGTLDTLGAGLGVRFRVTPTDEISERFQLRSKVTPKPAGYAAKSKVADLTTEEGATVVTWPALGLAAKKTYTFSVTFRVSKAAPSGTEFLLHAELFQAGISGVPPYCVRELGSRTLVRTCEHECSALLWKGAFFMNILCCYFFYLLTDGQVNKTTSSSATYYIYGRPGSREQKEEELWESRKGGGGGGERRGRTSCFSIFISASSRHQSA